MKKTTLIIISFIVLLFAACASKSYVKFVDNSIKKQIEITDVKKRVKSNGFTQIQVDGINKTGKYLLFKYRVVWEDKDGFEIKSISSNWSDFSAYKNANFRINIISPSKKAVDYQLYINKD
jgi:uncharacterized protein YcfL